MQAFPSDAKDRAKQGICDANASVRVASRWILGRTREEYVNVYRAALECASSSSEIAIALAALSEVGTAADATLASRYDGHPSPRVRRSALRCMMRLDANAYASGALRMLGDVSPAVSGAARVALRKQPLALTRFALLAILRDTQSSHVARNILLLLPQLPRWEGLLAMLDTATDARDEATVAMARRQIAQWDALAPRRHATPSRSEVAMVTAALARAEGALDAQIIANLRFTLSAFL